ncbi:MAG TPA: hypothetical protein VK892_10375 [Pyrinomonadaceae bacterium]|nr:hypothetical protein [Pyrinomonadaceae bacterium]
MKFKRPKAAPATKQSDFLERFNATGIKNDFEAYYGKKFENLQDDLANVLTSARPPKVFKLRKRCEMCRRAFVPARMSSIPKVCVSCLESAQAKPVRERRRFLDVALNNYQRLLRGALAV